MRLSVSAIVAVYSAFIIAMGTGFAQQTPTVLNATSSGNTGAAPNGIAASSSTGVVFTQPFHSATPPNQVRGVYSEDVNLGTATFLTSLPTNGVTAESDLAISPTGDIFANAASATPGKDDIYKNGVLFISGVPAAISKNQTGLSIDTVGTFGGALLVSADQTLTGYNPSSGSSLFSYSLPALYSSYVLQASDVAPLSYSACPGCLFVTAMPSANIDNPSPVGAGAIFTVAPNTPSPGFLTFFVSTGAIAEPESIHFVPANGVSCTLGKNGYAYFASGYATGAQQNNPDSTSGAILAWTPSQLPNGQFLIENEETAPPGLGTIFSYDGKSFNLFSVTQYQLEDTAILRCPTCETPLPPITFNVHENDTIGEIAWFNSHLTGLKGTIPTSIFQITITGGKITFGPSTLNVPDAVITFSPTATCAQTTFNVVFNRWETTLPLSAAGHADEIFAAGIAFLIPSGFPQNVNNVTWTANINSSAPGLQVTWQFGVSNWLTSHNGTSFPTLSKSPFVPDYNGMMIDPGHNVTTCGNFGGDHAGAPEFAGRQNVLTGGGSGGGGSNWTGSWSSTPSAVPVCQQH